MEGKFFLEAFDMALFDRASILIDEQLPQNCDFLVMDLVKTFGYSVYLWNDSDFHLRNALGKYNIQVRVASVYTSEYTYADIQDDVHTQRILGHSHRSKINIFRSSTATKRDYYDHGLIIKIEKLPSGCSGRLDGILTVFFRDTVYHNLKYKVSGDGVVYFNHAESGN